ncbi:MAG: DEAD/DEAH box helicase, partial [Acidimicrobiia bacterium]|nr:DEAD/DEAH box helicase [Acidimicrobiia bacterium]
MRTELDDLVTRLAGGDQLVHLERIPPRPARTASTARPLPPRIAKLLPEGGLWTHQAAAIDLARDAQSVAVATGTASGKSLCYQLPIAEAVTDTPPGTALLMFPTKALAQDQLRSLGTMDVPGLVAVTYDGDTPPNDRTWARRHANVVLTNPDMLHVGILPHHGRWSNFLAHLRFVVLDELHTLRGIFGSHV